MRAWLLLLLAGCNQIYGLDPTDLAAKLPVNGQLLHRWAENGPDGLPVVRDGALNATSDVYLSVRVGDTTTELDLDEAGQFTFFRSTEDEPYELEISIDGELFEVHHTTSTPAYVLRTAGRFDAEPVANAMSFSFPVTPGTVGGTIASTGIWASQQVGATVGSYNFDWQKAVASNARSGLVDTRKNDAFYYFDFETLMSPEGAYYNTIAGAAKLPVMVMGSTPGTLPAPPRVTTTPCSQLRAAFASEANRLAAAAPLFNRDADLVAAVAIPNVEVLAAGGIALAYGGNLLPPADAAVTPKLINPIAGSTLIASASTSRRREVRHPFATFATTARATAFHLVPMDCGTPTVIIPSPSVAIPKNPRLDGVPLESDDAEVTLERDRDLELTWSAADGQADWYGASVVELRNDPFDGTAIRIIRSIQTATLPIKIDPAGLVRGRYYILALSAYWGFPDGPAGDLRRVRYPFSGAETYTSIFKLR